MLRIAPILITLSVLSTQVWAQGTQDQKIAMIKQLKEEVAAKKTEVAALRGEYDGKNLRFKIADMGSTISGWATVLSAFYSPIGSILEGSSWRTLKQPNVAFFLGSVLVYAATKVTETYTKDQLDLTEKEKNQLETEISNLEQRLIGLEAGLVSESSN